MSLDYISEKLTNATRVLATSAAPIQKRLEWAALAAHTISGPPHAEEGFPTDELKNRFIAWWNGLTAKPDAGEGTLIATTKTLSDEDAEKFATELFDIYAEVEVYYVRHRRSHG